MLPFVLPVENSSAKKGRACAQCIGEAAGGARRVCGASNVKKNHDTLVECRKQKCVCAVQCVIRVSCGERFTRHMLGVDAGRAVGSQSRAAQRVCQSRWCALSRRGRRWRACDFVGGRSFSETNKMSKDVHTAHAALPGRQLGQQSTRKRLSTPLSSYASQNMSERNGAALRSSTV